EEVAVRMLRGLAGSLEVHHRVRILDEAVVDAVRLSSRYLTGRQLPDKCVGVLDTACARVALSQAGTPAAVEDLAHLMDALDCEMTALEREDPRPASRLAGLQERRRALEEDLRARRAEQEVQAALVREIQGLQVRLAPPGPEDETRVRERLGVAQAALREAHARLPMVYACVDSAAVAEVVSGWTGIPLGRMVVDGLETIRGLEARLSARVLGQDHALACIARHIQIARAGLGDPGKPLGVFLLVGPSGVGKTETALALAETLHGSERNLITLNLSEFQEAHTVSGLKGSPPGYVGYGEGGVLTEAVRRRPYSVILLDEAEKAHPDVLELFYQVFDKGWMEDAEGHGIDFRNTIILLTSNLGAELVMRAMEQGVQVDGKLRAPTPGDLEALMRGPLQKAFKPAFLGRLRVVPYYPVRDGVLKAIIELKLGRIRERIVARHGASLTWEEALVDLLAARCTEVESGARNADAILSTHLLSELSGRLLARMAERKAVRSIAVRLRGRKIQFRIA
ncbi:MAG TPA: AAA family ATPase, partial [Holophaga sp.]|nr:AAA family ATPase [Holophaga sp.]